MMPNEQYREFALNNPQWFDERGRRNALILEKNGVPFDFNCWTGFTLQLPENGGIQGISFRIDGTWKFGQGFTCLDETYKKFARYNNNWKKLGPIQIVKVIKHFRELERQWKIDHHNYMVNKSLENI